MSYIFWYCHLPPISTSWSVNLLVIVMVLALRSPWIFPMIECWELIFLQLKTQVNDWSSSLKLTTELWSYNVNCFHFLNIDNYFLYTFYWRSNISIQSIYLNLLLTSLKLYKSIVYYIGINFYKSLPMDILWISYTFYKSHVPKIKINDF